MRNFFYAPLIALMLLFVSCSDSDGIDNGTGDLDSEGVDATFVVQPQDVSFDTNLQRWDSKTVTFSVDPGSYRITTDSFSWKADSDISYGDYYTTKIAKTDVDNEFEITFRTLAGAEALVDSLEVPMTLIMTFNGFDQVYADAFNVILPADQYSSYFIDQPADAMFKAGFSVGDVCESRFTVDPQDAGALTFVVEESDNFSVEFFEGDEENEYIAQFTAKEAFKTAADAALAACGDGTPAYDVNVSVNETISITVVAENTEVDELEIVSNEFNVIAELADVAASFTSVSNIVFEKNFEMGDIYIGTIEIDPGTKNVSRTSFSMDDTENYTVVSFASAAATNTYSVYLNPTELSVGTSEDPEFEEEATISMTYDNYGEEVTLTSVPFKVFFEADEPELPSFTTTPVGMIFVSGSTTTTEVTATFIIDPGTYEITADSVYCVVNNYYTATFEATGSKNEYMATFLLKSAAFDLAPGSESAFVDATISVTCQGGVVESSTFAIEVEGRLNFDHYIYGLTHNAAICHVEGFDATVVASSEISEKGILYTTDQDADVSEWTWKVVEGASSNGGITAYEYVIGDLAPSTTYYIKPYVKQTDGYSYGEVTAFTTYANAAAVPQPGSISWEWNSAPVDETLKSGMEDAINEAVDYYNIYTSNIFSMKISYDDAASSSYIATGVMYLASGDYSVGRIMNLMMTFAGVGESTWTVSMISGNYYNKTRGNEFYQLITNQYGGSSKMPAYDTGIYVYDLVTSASGATLKPADATTASMVKLAVIMGLAYTDGLSGFEISTTDYILIDGINVALHKTATASATAIGYDPSNVTDGDKYSTLSRWLSSYTDSSWIQIDLGGEYTITGFNFYGGSGSVTTEGYDAGVMAYQFQYYSSLSNSWVDIISITGQSRSLGCFSQTFPTAVTCSQVRLVVTQSNQYTQMRVYELEVMSDFIR